MSFKGIRLSLRLSSGLGIGLMVSACFPTPQITSSKSARESQIVRSTMSDSEDHNSNDQTPIGALPGNQSSALSISAASEQSFNLGDRRVVSLTLQSSNYSGAVSLAVNRVGLDAVDREGVVGVTVRPDRVMLTPGAQVVIEVDFSVTTLAPSVSGGRESDRVAIVATPETGSAAVSSAIALRILPILEIRITGRDEFRVADQVIPPGGQVAVRPHAGGVTVRFVNYDSNGANNRHVVHGTGPLPHQDANQPLLVAPPGGVGGAYEQRVTSTTPSVVGTFYDHSYESSNRARRVVFNAPAM